LYLFLLAFFGLTLDYRLGLFTQIHEIVFHGGGGYDWDTVYNMPVWLRKFTFEKLKEHYEKQQEAINKQQNTLKNVSNKELSKPDIAPKPTTTTPTYTAKVPKK
jgi:hypothetical protein